MAANNGVKEILKKLNFNQKEANAFINSLEIVKKSFKEEINIEEELVGIIDGVFGNEIQKN
jgi:hypothetical protein